MEQKRADSQAWRETAEWLERVRARELAAMTDEEARRIMGTLVAADPVWRARREWSGLVEQQAIFARGRSK